MGRWLSLSLMAAALALSPVGLGIAACGSDPYGEGGGTSSGSATTDGGPGPTTLPDGAVATGDGAPPSRIGCNGRVDCERYVFVTSMRYTARLDGLAGADQKCQALADAAPPPIGGRGFRAWLSIVGSPADERLVHGTSAYKRVDDKMIAADWSRLTNAALVNAINLTEKKTLYEGDAWTGTTGGGKATNGSCDDWESTGGTGGTYGHATNTDNGWTQNGLKGCPSQLALYCFEQ